MKIKTNDMVKILVGKDKGKVAKVLRVFKDKDKVVVEGVNMVKRHVKPGAVSKEGGIINIERPIDVSNVMYYDEKTSVPSKIGYTVVDGKKYRVIKKSKETVK